MYLEPIADDVVTAADAIRRVRETRARLRANLIKPVESAAQFKEVAAQNDRAAPSPLPPPESPVWWWPRDYTDPFRPLQLSYSESWVGRSSQLLRRVTTADVLMIVAAYCGVLVKDITGPARTKRLVDIRHIAAWIAHQEVGSSTPAIGRRIGGRDHTTIIHAIRRVKDAVGEGSELGLMATDCYQHFVWAVNRSYAVQNFLSVSVDSRHRPVGGRFVAESECVESDANRGRPPTASRLLPSTPISEAP